jgi:hypothetical protein
MADQHWSTLITALILIPPSVTALRAGQASPGHAATPVAQVRERIERDRLEIRVYQGKQLVQLASFLELCIVEPISGPVKAIENLAHRSVAIVRSDKNPDRWEVYQDVWAGGGRELTLADNVFRVKQVLISSPRNPIELRLDEKVVNVEPGEAVLVL